MISKALNSNNDIFVINGKFATVTEGAQTVQHLRTRIDLIVYEQRDLQQCIRPYVTLP